jgi:isopropylmalate/homocitrate/citramalate synthase
VNTGYKTEKWFVSPWNYDEEVTKQFSFASDIKIHDVTLRDGEQQAGIVFSPEDKIEIAKRLARMKVHRIEAGMPAVSPQDEYAVKTIADSNLGAEIFSFCRCIVSDVEKSKEAGCKGVIVEVPSSKHLIKYGYKWPFERAVKSAIETTKAAHEAGLYTCFFTIDSTRADINELLDMIEQIAEEGHMDAFVLPDTFGVASPHAVPWAIRKIKARFDKPVEVHFHNHFGLGAANTLMALAAGASVAHVTLSGLGEGAGNSALEDVVLPLLTMYGIDLGIKTEQFLETSRFVCKLANHSLPPNRAIVGENVFKYESGIAAMFTLNSLEANMPLEVVPFLPELVGHKAIEIVMGKKAGKANVTDWLNKIGKTATDEENAEILAKVKDKGFEKKRLLTIEEFAEIADEVLASAKK